MITIAGQKVEHRPASVNVGRFDLSKSQRVATGEMVQEYIRTVRRVDVTWQYMPDNVLKTLLDTLAANKPFFSLKYPDAGGDETMTAYAGDINTGLWHTMGGVRYWQEVSVSFIEK